MTLSCSCVPEQRVEQRLEMRQEMRLLAVRVDGKKKRFDRTVENLYTAWAFAGPDGNVLRWSKMTGCFVRTRWPGPFMVFRKGRRGYNGKGFLAFEDNLEMARRRAEEIGGSVYERAFFQQLDDLVDALDQD